MYHSFDFQLFWILWHKMQMFNQQLNKGAINYSSWSRITVSSKFLILMSVNVNLFASNHMSKLTLQLCLPVSLQQFQCDTWPLGFLVALLTWRTSSCVEEASLLQLSMWVSVLRLLHSRFTFSFCGLWPALLPCLPLCCDLSKTTVNSYST